ncbi:MAG: sporulation protein YunB [Clostridia bacterium]|nr:sporulation protein YunB [Clostridia bacterium]
MSDKLKRLKFRIKTLRIGKYIFFFTLVFSLLTLWYFYETGFKPVLNQVAESRASYLATKAINESINSTLNEQNASYENLVVMVKDETGQIVGLITNIIAVNRLKSDLSTVINNNVSKIESTSVTVPIGSITGIDFLSGIGPRIRIGIVPTGSTQIDFKNEFISSGINQTLHRIILEVSTSVSIVMATKQRAGAEVTTSFPIAESIIVGRVPESFTNVESNPASVKDDVLNSD